VKSGRLPWRLYAPLSTGISTEVGEDLAEELIAKLLESD
jgi:hypothetical protein